MSCLSSPSGSFCVLDQRAIFRLEGADRLRYLNGQVSNDVSKAEENVLSACVLTAKGKLCGLVWIHAEKDNIRIDADYSLRDSLRERLERYIIADDVTVTDLSDECSLVHCVSESFAILSEDEQKKGERKRSWRFGVKGQDIFIPGERPSPVVEEMEKQGLKSLTPDEVEYYRIHNGIPKWGVELDENTLPQEARMEEYAVDFHKGCYVGQEVVSRIKSVGRVNRLLVGLESDGALEAGMKLISAPDTPLGTITSVSPVFGLSKWIGMGYVKRGFDAPGQCLLAVDAEKETQAQVRVRQFLPEWPSL